MAAHALGRPDVAEYNPYYARYIALVPEGDVVDTLAREMEATQALLASVPAEREEYRYAPGKWSVREVVGHLVDTERLFAFRALWFARGAGGELAGMDQDAWARVSSAGARPLAELAEEWRALRSANVLMFGSFTPEDGARRGVASGFEVTVRALPWMIAGHELYHRARIRSDYLGEQP
ncbi:MAG TPA: DinB family protein [Longimicrobiales bacterium]|nr:DinB family protein [Longimicrobiales bacterium]